MKFNELELRAFGPFAGEKLSFDGDNCVHLIYGHNEAGKSSLLRAVRAFLYGILRTTSDAHRHPMKKLRIAAKIEVAGGQVLELVRRKGNKATLVDANDRVVEDAEMARYLCGVGESLFNNLFGLDYESLRRGAESMLAGNGDVGESLFEAGGARGVHALLEKLRLECDAIYNARAQKRPLNALMRDFRAKKKEVQERSIRGGDYDAARAAFEQARLRYDDAKAKRRALDIERSRIERTLRVAPLLARLEELENYLMGLEGVPELSEDAAARRRHVQQQIQMAEHEQLSLQEELKELQRRCEQRMELASYLEVSDELVERIKSGIGKYEAAMRELPRRQRELDLRSAEVVAIAEGLSRSVDAMRAMPREAMLRSRLSSLVRDYERLQTRLQMVQEACDEQGVKLSQAKKRRAELEPDEEKERALHVAIREVIGLGSLDGEFTRIEQQGARTKTLALELRKRLESGRSEGDAADAESWLRCSLPSEAQIQQRQQQVQARRQSSQQLDEDEALLSRQLEENQVQIDSIELTGNVPSVQALQGLRQERDALFERIFEEQELRDSFLGVQGDADRMADQLFEQAEKVTQHARFRAERLALQRAAKDLQARRRNWLASGKEADAEWAELWRPSGFKALDAALMLELRTTHEKWRSLHEELRQLEEQREKLKQREARAMARLPVQAEGTPQQRLVAAEQELERLREERRRFKAMSEQIVQLEDELASRRLRLERARADDAAWKDSWCEALAALGLPGECPVAEAQSYVQAVDTALAKLDEADKLERRIAAMKDDAEAFRKSVHDVCEQVAANLVDTPLEEAAWRLAERCDQARFDAKELAQAQKLLKDKQTALRDVERKLGLAKQEQAQLLERAKVQTLEALETCEEQNARRRQLRADRDLTLKQVLEAGEGEPVASLRARQTPGEVDGLKARLNDIFVSQEELEQQLEMLRSEVSNSRSQLTRMEETEAGASAAAMELESLRAEAERYTEIYARKYLAVSLLEEQVETYRRENEGPVIGYARTMFQHLTLGGFGDLKVIQQGDKSALCAVRANGEELEVDGLSEGTRDQLYLALRLASLRRFAEAGTSLPLVLDDILVHFDERRSAAALALLADVARHNQVLLFTHHEHCIPLAEAAVGKERLRVHRLPGRSHSSA